jgi:hypothetical protein
MESHPNDYRGQSFAPVAWHFKHSVQDHQRDLPNLLQRHLWEVGFEYILENI